MPRKPRTRSDAPEWWNTDQWETPSEVFAEIEAVYGPFDLDAAASADNAKCRRFYTAAFNGLTQPWFGRVWVNPPYSNPEPWCQRAAYLTSECAAMEGVNGPQLVVMLLPAAVDTQWFHMYVIPFAAWKPLRGRPAFLDWNHEPRKGAKGGNVLAVYPGEGLLP